MAKGDEHVVVRRAGLISEKVHGADRDTFQPKDERTQVSTEADRDIN
jgi:hypothetical protein